MTQNKYPTVLIHKRGEERDNHKYVKREWKNGKWKYWYEDVKDKLGVDERQALKRKEDVLERQTAIYEKSKLEKKKSDIRLKYEPNSTELQTENKKAANDAKRTQDRMNRFKKQAQDLADEYGKTPLGKVEKAIDSGVKAVDKLLGISAKKDRKENAAKSEKEREELFRVARNEASKAARKEVERIEAETKKKQELSEKYAKEREKYEKEIKENQRKKAAEERTKVESKTSGRSKGMSKTPKTVIDNAEKTTQKNSGRYRGLTSTQNTTTTVVRKKTESEVKKEEEPKKTTQTSNGRRRDTTEADKRKRENNSRTYNARRRGLR